MSYYEQISDVTRDQKITAQAQDALGELTRRYPNTRYAADARLKIDLVRDHLAGKDDMKGRLGRYVGYNPANNSHRVWCDATDTTRASYRESRHVRFLGSTVPPDVLTGKVPLRAPGYW